MRIGSGAAYVRDHIELRRRQEYSVGALSFRRKEAIYGQRAPCIISSSSQRQRHLGFDLYEVLPNYRNRKRRSQTRSGGRNSRLRRLEFRTGVLSREPRFRLGLFRLVLLAVGFLPFSFPALHLFFGNLEHGADGVIHPCGFGLAGYGGCWSDIHGYSVPPLA